MCSAYGRSDTLKLFLETDPLALNDDKGEFYAVIPLINAIYGGHIETAKVLLEHRPSLIMAEDPQYNSYPLAFAIRKGMVEIIELLIKAGADVQVVSHCGHSSISEALMAHQPESLRILLNHGARFNPDNTIDNTPFMDAVLACSLVMLKMLIEADHDFLLSYSPAKHFGNTPVHLTIRHGFVDHWPLCYWLSDACLPTMHVDHFKKLRAADSEWTELLRYVIRISDNTTARNDNGLTPLHLACQDGNMGSVKLLIDEGAHIDARSSENATPFHCAVMAGHEAVVELLLAHGVDAESESDLGTPRSLALLQRSRWKDRLGPLNPIDARWDRILKLLPKSEKEDEVLLQAAIALVRAAGTSFRLQYAEIGSYTRYYDTTTPSDSEHTGGAKESPQRNPGYYQDV